MKTDQYGLEWTWDHTREAWIGVNDQGFGVIVPINMPLLDLFTGNTGETFALHLVVAVADMQSAAALHVGAPR